MKLTAQWAKEQVDHNGKLILQKDGDFSESSYCFNDAGPTYKPMLITRAELLIRLVEAQRRIEYIQKSQAVMEELLNGPIYIPFDVTKHGMAT